jgi:uncharacterized protein YggE
MRHLTIVLLLAFARVSAAQLQDNTITVTVSSGPTIQADAVGFFVRVETPLTATLDDVLAQLKGSAITAANLSYVSTSFDSSGPQADWSFTLTVPFSRFKETTAVLAKLSAGSIDQNGGQAITVSVSGVQMSDDARARQCPLPALVSDARKQADIMAASAGMKAGAIVSISDGSSVDGEQISVPYVLGFASPAYGTGSVTPGGFYTGQVRVVSPACLLTVQFKLQ